METRITTGTLVALGFSAVLVYAAPQTRPSTGAPPGATAAGIGADRNQQATTMTGCLRQGSSPRSFVFTQSPGTSVPDGGVGAAGGRPQQGNRYELMADSKTDLSKMVGRQVEVTGMQTIGPGGATPSTGNDRSAASPGAATPDPSQQGRGGNDQSLGRERTADQPTAGGGTGERNRPAGDAGLTRFNVKTIKQTGTSC